MNQEDKVLLDEIVEKDPTAADSYNIRKNGKSIDRKINPNIEIVSKKDNTGIDVYVKEDTLFGTVNIPVIITESGLTDVVYNDFHIGKNANVIIVAGCGIHNDGDKDSSHNGIHSFFIGNNCKVKYVEKHFALGKGKSKKILNPVTKIEVGKNSIVEMETVQIGGVTKSTRKTFASVKENSSLIIKEKILTENRESAKTEFKVVLLGENSKVDVVSRSVAKGRSRQDFVSSVIGKTVCFGHVECDGILSDNAKISSLPKIVAFSPNATLIHEAAIGKISQEQQEKLMSMGLTKEEAENVIIKGFLN